MAYQANSPIQNPLFHFILVRADGTVCCGANGGLDGLRPELVEGAGLVEATLTHLELPPSQYFVAAYVSNLEHTVDYAQRASRSFAVLPHPFADTRLGGYIVRASWRQSGAGNPAAEGAE
jgi:hypothetical protein